MTLKVYISIEKLVSIKYPAKKFFMRRKVNQLLYLLIVIAYNSLFYLPISYYINVVKIGTPNVANSSNETLKCSFVSDESMAILNIMDAINRVILPTFIMLISSLVLFSSILRMRARISETFRSTNTHDLREKVKLLVSLIFLNIINILLTSPMAVIDVYDMESVSFAFTLYLWFASYGCNFYIILATNSLFRKQFLKYFA